MKVAIVARAGTSSLAPWRDMGWEIWGMPWISYPRVTRLFDVHSQAFFGNEGDWFSDESWLQPAIERYPNIPWYCDPSRVSKYPNAIAFPLDEVNQSIPIPFYENSIAYQLALAIHEGAKEIGLWGVHMMGRLEFAIERPSVAYLIGLAQGRGINVIVAPGSPLFMSGYVNGRYGVSRELRVFPNANTGVCEAYSR